MTAPKPTATPRRGRVEEFDERVGIGTLGSAEGEVFPFHCTQIAGGSRSIEVGTEVTFTVVAGRLGRWEAAGVGPAADGSVR